MQENEGSEFLKLSLPPPSPLPLDTDVSNMSSSTTAPATDSASYIQVVVKKQHSKKDAQRRGPEQLDNAVQTSPTLPHRSSRIINMCECGLMTATGDGAETVAEGAKGNEAPPALYVLPHHMLLAAYPHCMYQPKSVAEAAAFYKLKECEEQRPPPHRPDVSAQQANASSKHWIKDTFSKFNVGEIPLADFSSGPEKVELYMFDRGCADYYATTDRAPLTCADRLAARADRAAARCWAELLAVPAVVLATFAAAPPHLLRLMLGSVVRPLLVGSLQTCSDYLLKPALAVLFNALLQPPLLLLLNVLASARDALAPLADTLASFLRPLGGLLRSVRLVQVTRCADKCTHRV